MKPFFQQSDWIPKVEIIYDVPSGNVVILLFHPPPPPQKKTITSDLKSFLFLFYFFRETFIDNLNLN